jgi:hypothetical protein
VLALSSLCSSLASAEDGGMRESKIAKQFVQHLQIGPGKAAAPSQVDPRLCAMFVDKVTECYLAETSAPLKAEDRTLLATYAAELLPQFQGALKPTGCEVDKPATDACLTQLSKMDCEPLAQVVHDTGWDRAPSPEMVATIDLYTQKLAARYFVCRSNGEIDEEATRVRAEYTSHSSSLQIALLLTTGQCSLVQEQLEPCLAQLAAPDACKAVLEAAQLSRLPRYCKAFLDCSNEPALIQHIAK